MKARQLFIHTIAVISLLILTGFVGIFPNILHSSIDRMYAISIEEAMSGINTLKVVFVTVLVFFPIILGYQGWKYYRFRDKVKLNDE